MRNVKYKGVVYIFSALFLIYEIFPFMKYLGKLLGGNEDNKNLSILILTMIIATSVSVLILTYLVKRDFTKKRYFFLLGLLILVLSNFSIIAIGYVGFILAYLFFGKDSF